MELTRLDCLLDHWRIVCQCSISATPANWASVALLASWRPFCFLMSCAPGPRMTALALQSGSLLQIGNTRSRGWRWTGSLLSSNAAVTWPHDMACRLSARPRREMITTHRAKGIISGTGHCCGAVTVNAALRQNVSLETTLKSNKQEQPILTAEKAEQEGLEEPADGRTADIEICVFCSHKRLQGQREAPRPGRLSTYVGKSVLIAYSYRLVGLYLVVGQSYTHRWDVH